MEEFTGFFYTGVDCQAFLFVVCGVGRPVGSLGTVVWPEDEVRLERHYVLTTDGFELVWHRLSSSGSAGVFWGSPWVPHCLWWVLSLFPSSLREVADLVLLASALLRNFEGRPLLPAHDRLPCTVPFHCVDELRSLSTRDFELRG